MANDFTAGFGIRLRRGQTTPIPVSETVYADVGYVKGIRLPNIEKEFVEEETLDQGGALIASGGQKPQDVEFSIVLDVSEAQHLALIADAQANTANSRRWWQIVLPNATLYPINFRGELVTFTFDEATKKSMVAAKCVIKINQTATFGS